MEFLNLRDVTLARVRALRNAPEETARRQQERTQLQSKELTADEELSILQRLISDERKRQGIEVAQ